MNLNELLVELKDECEKMITDLGMVVPTNIDYILKKSNSRRLGQCSKRYSYGGYKYIIEINETYMKAYVDNNMIEPIKKVLLHEICHTMPNGMSHGVAWKSYIHKINMAYGYDIKRLAQNDNITDDVYNRQSKIKYIITCDTCGNKTNYQRKPKYLDVINTVGMCTKCNGRHFTVVNVNEKQ